MKEKLLIVSAIIIIIITYSCKDNSTQPPVNNYKHPRDMTWTADTLTTDDPNQLQIIPQNLLVFSPNDAWLCCWADGPLGQMWHYDGTEWKVNNILKDVVGKPADIVGFSSRYLWTGGYIGDYVFIAQYNGNNWTDIFPGFYTIDQEDWLKGDILDMSTDEDGNIWACGRNGLVMKYENNTWIADTIKVGYLNLYPDTQYSLYGLGYYNGEVYVLGAIIDFNRKRDIYYFFSGDTQNWQLKDSMIIDSPSSVLKWGYFGLHRSVDNILYSFGGLGIWEKTNQEWEKIFDLGGEVYGMYSMNANYIIAVSAFKRIYFYNGSSWESISDLFKVTDPTFVFKNVWSDGNEIIITGYGSVNNKEGTIIWHGK